MSKAKGSRSERELFHKLWEHNFAVVRSAGSGSTTKPAPDLIASNGKKILALECKAVKGVKKYFEEDEIRQLVEFSSSFGAEPWIAVRFDNKGWFFIRAHDVPQSKGSSLVVSYSVAQKIGKRFEEIVGNFSQERLL